MDSYIGVGELVALGEYKISDVQIALASAGTQLVMAQKKKLTAAQKAKANSIRADLVTIQAQFAARTISGTASQDYLKTTMDRVTDLTLEIRKLIIGEEKDEGGGGGPGKEPWYKNPLYIGLIAGGALLLIGGVAFVRRKK